MKKWLSLLLAMIMALSMAACGKTVTDEDKSDTDTEQLVVATGIPSYEDDIQIELAAYAGPRRAGYRNYNGVEGAHPDDPEEGWEGWITEEDFQDYMDCGFTYLLPEYDAMYDATKTFEYSSLYEYMELAEKMGIPVVVSASQLVQLTGTDDYRLHDDAKSMMTELVENLSSYKTFKGFTFRDEPVYQYARSFGAVQDYLTSLKSDLFYFTSLLPIYAQPTVFTDNYTGDLEEAYKDYVNLYIEETGTFAYDNYPLWIDPVSGETSLDDAWLQNLKVVAECAKQQDCDTGITLQSCGFSAAGEWETSRHKRGITSKEDVSFQVYSSLAYGMKYITYFTYWQHWTERDGEMFYDAMVLYPEENGQDPVKTDAYYAVKEVNEEIKKFDHVFLKYDWEGTMTLTNENTEKSLFLSQGGDYSSPRIKEAVATEETIIGCMKDEDGYDGFMIVNVTDPGQNISDKVTVTFREATQAMIYVNGEEKMVDLEDGSYTFELASGEGVFAIPIQ